MEKDKKLGIFNFGAAFLGFIWSFKNNCQVEYFTMFALLAVAIPLFLYVAGFFLIIIFGPSENLGSFVIAMMWGYYAWKLFLVGLLVFSIFVGFRANKWVLKNATKRNEDIELVVERNNKWNKIAILVFLIVFSIYLGLSRLLSLKAAKRQQQANIVKNELKQQNCQILMDTYREVYSKYGNGFSNEDFINVLITNPSVLVPANSNDFFPEIHAIINHIGSNFKIRKLGECDINEQNCYIYVNNSACQFYFDSKGKIELSQGTKEKYKNLK